MSKNKNTSTRDRILDEAERMFHLKGVYSTSISDLVEATGVQKGTIYHHFSDKQELAVSVVGRAGEEFLSFIRDSVTGKTPRERIYSFLEAAYKKHEKLGFVGGCPFGNMALETSDTRPELATVVSEVFDDWAEILEREIREAQECGQIRDEFSSETLAHHVIAVLEGGIMQGRLRKDATIFKSNIECLKRFLDS